MSARRAFDSFGPAARRGASRDGMTCLGEVSERGHLVATRGMVLPTLTNSKSRSRLADVPERSRAGAFAKSSLFLRKHFLLPAAGYSSCSLVVRLSRGQGPLRRRPLNLLTERIWPGRSVGMPNPLPYRTYGNWMILPRFFANHGTLLHDFWEWSFCSLNPATESKATAGYNTKNFVDILCVPR
jgi:hypothetical protein